MEELAICLHTFSANVASQGNITSVSQVLAKSMHPAKEMFTEILATKIRPDAAANSA